MTTPPSTTAPDSSVRAPNVVIIYADDLGYGDLGCFGAEYATPHLDDLARRGVRATDWYSNSPVCSPSRAALLTGRDPDRTGVTRILGGGRSVAGLSTDHPTLATRLREHGYDCGAFGKWHLGLTPQTRPSAHGFQHYLGFLAGCVDYYSHIYYWGHSFGDPTHDLWDGDQETWRNGEYLTELIADEAADYIDEHADRPFFCYVAFNAPHYPMHAPQRYLDRFPDLAPQRRIMAAMIAAMDDGVGHIVETLRRHDLLDDTIIMFSSDNGPSRETRNWLDGNRAPWDGGTTGGFRGHKGSLFDGGIREPFLISYPRCLPEGRLHTEPAQMSDVVPTVMALAGLPVPADVDGVDRSEGLRGGGEDSERTLFWSYQDQLAARRGSWKLVLDGWLDLSTPGSEEVHLSDLTDDPGEQRNLAEARPDVVEELGAAVRGWSHRLTAVR